MFKRSEKLIYPKIYYSFGQANLLVHRPKACVDKSTLDKQESFKSIEKKLYRNLDYAS